MPTKPEPKTSAAPRVRVRVVVSFDGFNVNEAWIDEMSPWIAARVAVGYLEAEEVAEDAGTSGEGGAV